MQNIVILGSTGSIGCNALDVIGVHLDEFKVFALCAHSNVDKLLEQCLRFKPQYVVLNNKHSIQDMRHKLKIHNIDYIKLLDHEHALLDIVTHVDVHIIVSSMVGSVGIKPNYEAIKAGKTILLANKESLVACGELIMNALKTNKNAHLVPIDSEHSAILQSMPSLYNIGDNCKETINVNKIILTASGGPFRAFTAEQLGMVTPNMALKHPNWSMGNKITIDCATLMNKGLELIEAKFLFNISPEYLDVVVHPQSIIHSLVEYNDYSMVAQLSNPDMRLPIAYALSYPKRLNLQNMHLGCKPYSPLNLASLGSLTFESPKYELFPCLNIAIQALKSGGNAPLVVNAANEVAVELFLNNKIGFNDIPAIITKCLEHFPTQKYHSCDEAVALDLEVKSYCRIC